MNLLSIVIPVFNEYQSIPELINRFNNTGIQLKKLNVEIEIIFVDDHSSDNTSDLLKEYSLKQSNISYIRLSKNSGSHIAIIAGFYHCKGDCAIFMAADLQDPPELIEKLINLWQEKNDVVWAVRETIEGISASTLLFSKLFYSIMNSGSSIKLPPTGADFALLDRKVITGIIRSAGSNPSLGSLIVSLGFKQTGIYYTKEARRYGKSKWTLSKKMFAFLDAFIGFSYIPMRIMIYFGLIMAFLGFLYAILVATLKLTSGKQIEGWASLMIVVLIIGGVQMIMMGVIGEYLWRNLEESRKKPLYFIEDSSGNIFKNE